MVDIDSMPINDMNDAVIDANVDTVEIVAREAITIEQDKPIDGCPAIVKKPICGGSRGHRPKMSESKKLNVYKKEECLDCGKMLTVGHLRYKHTRFCVGKNMKKKKEDEARTQVQVKLLPVSDREIMRRVDDFNTSNTKKEIEPESEIEVVRRYVSNLKQQQHEKTTMRFKNLINSAIVRRIKT